MNPETELEEVKQLASKILGYVAHSVSCRRVRSAQAGDDPECLTQCSCGKDALVAKLKTHGVFWQPSRQDIADWCAMATP